MLRIQLKCVAVGRALSSVFLVMEYCEHDLASLVDHMPCPFAEPVVKCLLLQTIRGTHIATFLPSLRV